MKTLVRKELREHRWIVLSAGVLLSLVFVRAFYDLNPSQAAEALQRRSSIVVIALVAGAFLFLLGHQQTWRAKQQGSWAFLVHRPLSIGRIFAAKVIAGGIAYSLAVLLPTSMAVAWYAWPGNIAAPFDLSMLTPMAVDLACALPYYFAGIGIASWPARWPPARGLLLVVPLSLSVLSHMPRYMNSMYTVGDAFVWAALVTLTMALCAKAVFADATSGRSKFGLMGVLALSIALAQVFVVALSPQLQGHRRLPSEVLEHWTVLHGGEIRRIVRRDGRVEGLFDEAGNEVPLPDDLELRRMQVPVARLDGGHLRELEDRDHYRDYRRFERLAQPGDDYTLEWYFDSETRVFVAFDRETAMPAGTLGRDGFSPSGTALPFEGSRLNEMRLIEPLLIVEGGAYRIDWRGPSVERVSLPGDRLIRDYEELSGPGQTLRFVTSADHVHVFQETELSVSLPYAELESGSNVAGYVASTGEFFIRQESDDTCRYTFYSARGEELRRVPLPTLEREELAERWHEQMLRPTAAAVLLPPAFVVSSYLRQGEEFPEWNTAHVATALGMALLALLLGAFVARRHAPGQRWMIASLCCLGGPLVAALAWLVPRSRTLTPVEHAGPDPAFLIDADWMPPRDDSNESPSAQV